MKDILYLFVLALCWIFISCESSVQPKQNVVNESPIITIVQADSIISLGDTLKLTLHVENALLQNGLIDFGDSSIVVFKNQRAVFDTTLVHYYTSSKSYRITVSFSNGEKKTTKYIDVSVLNYSMPIVTLEPNKLLINVTEDTLRITLHASDRSLSSGTLNFKDGFTISFSNLHQVFDTTIWHIYSQSGTYSVTASFSDGDTVTSKSSTITVANSSAPVVTITTNANSFEYNDTVKVTLYASDRTLSSGTLDFKDGCRMSFSNLHQVFDTTIWHIYSQSGTYSVTASFSDGDTVTSKSNIITVTKNPAPVVTITSNEKEVAFGDTVKVTLHASDRTLSSGTLDFKDGSIISFSNLHQVLDTTIAHIYSQARTYYVTASFSNEYTSTNSVVRIAIFSSTSHHYDLKLSVGMIWRFNYNYSGGNRYSTRNEWGIHEWEIISSTISNQDTTFIVNQSRRDSVYEYDAGFKRYSSINDASQFTIIVTNGNIQFNALLASGSITLPNHTYYDDYPIKISEISGYKELEMMFEDVVGLTKYRYSNFSQFGSQSEDLILTYFSKP